MSIFKKKKKGENEPKMIAKITRKKQKIIIEFPEKAPSEKQEIVLTY